MSIKVPIDKAGRVIIPKPLREAFHLTPGDSLEIEDSGDEITLRPVRETISLRKENGFWVYRTGQSLDNLSLSAEIEKDREERGRRLAQ